MEHDQEGVQPEESGAGADVAMVSPWEAPVPGGDSDQDALELENKAFKRGQKGKELDARWFDDKEWETFREADREQRAAHIQSGAIRVIPKSEAHKTDRARILPIPARFARTNKDKDSGLKAKSRLVVLVTWHQRSRSVRTPPRPRSLRFICC